MKRRTISLLAILSIAALAAGGCANKEAVKAEEPIAATAPSQAEAAKVETPKVEAPTAEAVKSAEAKSAEATAAQSQAEAAFETAYFDFDKSDLRPDTRDVLSKNADTMLKTKKDVKVKIEGHCDERGSAEYNLALGERRAKSALHYLLTLGVAANRLSTISYGKERPAVQGSNEEAWAKNRRAEFVIVK